jgi:hypothetical protein
VRGRAAANRKLVDDVVRKATINSLLTGITGEKFDDTQFVYGINHQDPNHHQLDNLNRETLKEQLLLKDLDMQGDSPSSEGSNNIANVADFETVMDDASLYRQDLARCAKLLGIPVLDMLMLDGVGHADARRVHHRAQPMAGHDRGRHPRAVPQRPCRCHLRGLDRTRQDHLCRRRSARGKSSGKSRRPRASGHR